MVSDSDALEFLWSKHKVAGTYKEAVQQAIDAGMNVRCTFSPPAIFILPLRELVREGKLSMATIADRVRDVDVVGSRHELGSRTRGIQSDDWRVGGGHSTGRHFRTAVCRKNTILKRRLTCLIGRILTCGQFYPPCLRF